MTRLEEAVYQVLRSTKDVGTSSKSRDMERWPGGDGAENKSSTEELAISSTVKCFHSRNIDAVSFAGIQFFIVNSNRWWRAISDLY